MAESYVMDHIQVRIYQGVWRLTSQADILMRRQCNYLFEQE